MGDFGNRLRGQRFGASCLSFLLKPSFLGCKLSLLILKLKLEHALLVAKCEIHLLSLALQLRTLGCLHRFSKGPQRMLRIGGGMRRSLRSVSSGVEGGGC